MWAITSGAHEYPLISNAHHTNTPRGVLCAPVRSPTDAGDAKHWALDLLRAFVRRKCDYLLVNHINWIKTAPRMQILRELRVQPDLNSKTNQ